MATRATPLSPDARRASIIAATLPLLRRYGASVTTAQIALAAGVAEGTLFRAFTDKDALLGAAIQSAFDAEPTEAKLAAIDRGLPLRDQLVVIVEILQERVEQVWQLMTILNLPAPPQKPDVHGDAGIRAQIVAIFELHHDELRVDPSYAQRTLRALAFAGTHPRITEGQPFTAREIVAILLDGLARRPDPELT
ncbi:MAG: helix-turn-helix domain-containing protein [Kofleriaceae bacterium]